MVGWFRTFTRDFQGAPNQGNHNEFASEKLSAGVMKGIVFDRNRAGTATERGGRPICNRRNGSLRELRSAITLHFQPKAMERRFGAVSQKTGDWQMTMTSWVSDGEKLAGAIAVRFTLQPGEKKVIPMVIAWDFPVVQFGEGREWNRRYTDFYGTNGNNAWAIARDGLQNATAWSDAIDAWQVSLCQ